MAPIDLNLLQRELNTQGHFNVLLEGAVGDGVVNDTTAIGSAITKSIAGGYKLVFPPGKTFLISATLILPSAVEIDFNGSTLKKSSTFSGFGINVTGTGCKLSNLVLNGNRTAGSTGGGIQFTKTGSLWNSNVSHCLASAVQALGAGAEVDCYSVVCDDNVGGSTNADGFYAATSAVLRLHDCSAYGNDRQGVFIDTSAATGCLITGRYNANKRAGISIRNASGNVPWVICDDNRQYGIALERDPVGWSFGNVTVSNTGQNLSGLWTTNNAGTGVEMFGATNCKFDYVMARLNLGYGVAITTDTTTLTRSQYNSFGNVTVYFVYTALNRDPGIHFSEGAAHNSIGSAMVVGATVAVILGEDGVAATNNYNSIGYLHAELCDYGALRINKGSFNHFGTIVARNCSTTDAVYKGVLDFSTASTVSNTVQYFAQADDAGPATTLAVNGVRFDALAVTNKVIAGIARSVSGTLNVDLNGGNTSGVTAS